ncbi:E3 ubiquitin-protein ligase MARCH8 [Cucumis melo var. makuwa]|uniref:E3 ubiquitin-protein ligase MARCH8 n=1 Tax=Cucumis melo var. makuwa TaxID=1194695 RepID=A0A5A7UV53_CUCMM|nr:E3 ubiquitin-protein ligase MARCH8 [Cucumis melo var. makuwa]
MKEEVQFESSIGQNPSDFDPLLENQNDSSSHGTSDEIDTEASSIPSCRICLESDAESGEFHC